MNAHPARPQRAAAVSVSPATTRDHALDALRTLAIIGMMASHTARLMPRDVRPGWASFALLIEPVIPTLFLLLVGLSLARSFIAAQGRGLAAGAWYRRQLKRAGALWVISFVFFTLEFGVRLPDALLAGGILATIAYAIMLVGGLLALGRGAGPLLATLAAGLVAFVVFDARGVRIHPLNIGNSPFIPLWLFAVAGGAWGVWFGPPGERRVGHTDTAPDRAAVPKGQEGQEVQGREEARDPDLRRRLALALGLAGAALAVALIARYGLEPLFTKPFGRGDAGRLVPAPLFTPFDVEGRGGGPIFIAYYNLRPMLALACLGLQLGALTALGAALAHLPARAAGWAFALGRHALVAYMLHLALLSLVVVSTGDPQPLATGLQGTLLWLGLILICHLVTRALLLRRGDNIVHFRH